MIHNFKLTGGLFSRYAKLLCDTVIPIQEEILNDRIEGVPKSHAIANLRNASIKIKRGEKAEDGDFYGRVAQDSDVSKWLEAAAYSLLIKPDAELSQRIDELCDLIASAQEEDGYLDTHFTLKRPEDKFTNLLEAHELYCSGHMIEAAVALYETTGKRKLLDVAEKNANLLYKHFIEEGAEGYPGHPEIELALMRLWRATDNEKYRELSEHFINVRGVDAEYYTKEVNRRNWKVWGNDPANGEYQQSHLPVRQQPDAVGHSVRAVYLYTAMADIAAVSDDSKLTEACFRLFDSITKRRMYITGGIGSTCHGEAFTKDYDLPNDTAYAETCASVGLILFASKMLKLKRDGRFADVIERALYNTVLAGIGLDGKNFFYVNPLEAIPGVSGVIPTHRHALPQRPSWFGCPCCPTNAARLLTSISKYIWEEMDGVLYANLYATGTLTLPQVVIQAETDYPFGDTVKYTVKSGKIDFGIHIPEFTARNYTVSMPGEYRDGYYYLTVKEGDVVEIKLDMTPRLNLANTKVAQNSGLGAVTVGPLVYCAEGIDNDDHIFDFTLDGSRLCLKTESPASAAPDFKTIYTVTAGGARLVQDDPGALYFSDGYHYEEGTLKLIPYFMWGNRGLNKMRVWFPVKQ